MIEEEELDEEEARVSAEKEKTTGMDTDGAAEIADVTSLEKEENVAETSESGARRRLRLDLEVEASGFGRAMQRELEDVSIGYPASLAVRAW